MGITIIQKLNATKGRICRMLLLATLTLLTATAAMAQGKTAYAIWTAGNSTLTFLCSETAYAASDEFNGQQITNLWSGDDVLSSPTDGSPAWNSIVKSKVKAIVFDESFADARPTSIARWFDNSVTNSQSANTLATVTGIQNLNTSEVTSMREAFFRSSTLKNLDLSGFDTKNVTNMYRMFYDCNSLESLDISSFNTAKVADMSYMFYNCNSLPEVNTSSFNTANVTDFSYMFYQCTSLNAIDVSGFTTGSASNMSNMFNGCSSVKELDVTNFDVSRMTPAYYITTGVGNMFANCSSLVTIRAAEGTDWSGTNDANENIFSGCSKLFGVGTDGSISTDLLPKGCKDGSGIFTTVTGHVIYFVGGNDGEFKLQIVNKSAKTATLDLNTFTVADKSFGSWNTDKDGKGTSYYDGDEIELTSNIMLYSQWGRDIALCDDPEVNPRAFTYNGSACEPSISLVDNYTGLVRNKDFVVEYTNNINAGTATATIRGIGDYAGRLTVDYIIREANISTATISPQRVILVYDGTVQAPEYVLRNSNNDLLVEGTDYTVSGLDGNSATGDYVVTFTGIGNYTGTTTATYTITAQNAYAVWTEDNTTLTFIMTEDKPEVGSDFDGATVTAVWSGDEVLKSPQNGRPAWNSVVKDKITTVTFDGTFAEASPKSIAYWFDNTGSSNESASSLTTINSIKNLNTSSTTSMEGAFNNCAALTRLDVTKFNTELVTNMGRMFYGCKNLQLINVSGFSTVSVTDMSHLFEGCSTISGLSIDGFKTSNVTDFSYMFSGCTSLTELSVSNLATDNAENFEYMFSGCAALTSINVANFITKSATNMRGMFAGCSGVSTLNIAGFITDNVTDMKQMFEGCSGLLSLDVKNFNTSNVTDMSSMFGGCTNLTTLDVSGFSTSNVTSFASMFKGLKFVESLSVGKFNTAKATDMSLMFAGCSMLTELNLSSFETGSVTDFGGMFSDCGALKTIRVAAFTDWSGSASTANMFDGCSALVGVGSDGTHCDYQDGLVAPAVCLSGTGYFTPDDIFVLTFHKNIDDFAILYQVVSKTNTEPVTLAPITFDTDSYVFGGWDSKADGSGTHYKDEQQINVGQDMDFYAQWGKDISTLIASTELVLPSSTYTGSPIMPAVRITDGSTRLVQGTDFTIDFENNTDVYTGDDEDLKPAVVITGKGDYAGEYKVYFDITPFNIVSVTIKPEYQIFTYNGEVQVPDFVITDRNGNTLEIDKDYIITTDISNNINAAEYVVDIQGIGNYTGTNYASYAISNAYAIWTQTNSTLTFMLSEIKYDQSKSVDGHKVTTVWQGDDVTKSGDAPAWSSVLPSVTTVTFQDNFAGVLPTSLAAWFANATNLTTINNIENLNTSEATSIASLFKGCKSLEELDLTNFNTKNVTDMSDAFNGCEKITELDISSFDVSSVTNMDGMFANCQSLELIRQKDGADSWLSDTRTTNGMFTGDNSLIGIGLDNSFCKYAAGEDYPSICKNEIGYFTVSHVFIVTFDNNADGEKAYQLVNANTTAPTKLRSNTFTLADRLFNKWNTEADGYGTSYDDGAEVRIISDLTLYATWKRDIGTCSATFDPAAPKYDGSEITPAYTITDGDYTLVENVDYVFENFTDNVDAGPASLIVRGKGNYAGNGAFTFQILPRSLAEVTLTVSSGSTSFEFNNQPQVPVYTLEYDGLTLVEGKDYEVTATDGNIDAGSYTVTFTGLNNFADTRDESYEITPRDIVNAEVAIADQEYTGSPITPEISIYDLGELLTADKDFTVTFADNTNAGQATATITGIGNYQGSLSSEFTIKPCDLSKVTITPQNASLTYNRNAQMPEYSLSLNDFALVAGTDYTVEDASKTDVGTGYPVKFTAVEPGNFTGEATATFSIEQLDFSENATIVFENDIASFKYTGELIVPTVSVVDNFDNTLVEGEDYTLANPGNTNIGKYQITATGKGNYKGEVTAEYIIREKDINDATVTIEQGPWTYDGTEKTPAVISVVDGDATLAEGTDYKVAYENNTDAGSDATVLINGLGKYDASTQKVSFTINPLDISDLTVQTSDETLVFNWEPQIVSYSLTDNFGKAVNLAPADYSNNINAGDYEVALQGTGNHTGTTNVRYTINPRSIADVEVASGTIKNVYNGSEQTIELTVVDGEHTLTLDTDYKVDYTDNKNVGRATATVSGINNYTGTAAQTPIFEIVPFDFASVALNPESDATPYIGAPTMPKCTPTDPFDNVLEEGTDYTVSDFSNNIEVGEGYTVTFTGKGNYSDASQTITYRIKPRTFDDIELVYVDDKKEFTYTGSEIRPIEKVLDLGKELVEGVDYIINYNNSNIEPGTANVTITGRGTYKGEGNTPQTKTDQFTILKIDMADVKVVASPETFHYNRTAQAPEFTLTDPNDNTVPATEYTIDGIENNIDAAEYTVTFTANDNSAHYQGTKTTTYTILPRVITADDLKVEFVDHFTYTGSPITPDVKITYDNDDVLVLGTDFTISTTENINVGTVTMTLTGAGNFAGFTIDGNTYEILPYAMSDVTITPDKDQFTFNGDDQAPVYTLTDANGNTLVADQDFTLDGDLNGKNAKTYTTKFTGQGNYTGNVERQFTIAPFDIQNATLAFVDGVSEFEYSGENITPLFSLSANGTTIANGIDYTLSGETTAKNAGIHTIHAEGKGNYTNTLDIKYSIKPKNIEGVAQITFDNITGKYIETGSPIEPAVTVFDGSQDLEPTDYEVSYADNTEPGTAKVTVTGIGNYEGFTKTVDFTILPSTPVITFNVDENTPLGYGTSLIGRDIVASVDETYNGEIAYDLEGMLKPATYTVKATYTPNDNTTNAAEGTATFTVEKRVLSVTGVEVESTKDYDGTTTATVTKQPSISNVVAGEEVSVTATAAYDNTKPGDSKTITITYELSGKDKDNYTVRTTTVAGVINPVKITAAQKWLDENSTAIDYMSSTENTDHPHFCAGDKIVVELSNTTGMPTSYRVQFPNSEIQDITADYPEDGRIEITIPNVKYGKYTAVVTLINDDAESQSEAFEPFEFYIDGAVYGEDAIVKTKWDDVVYASNADREFISYQWYRDGKPLIGETGQYYQEKNGLVASAQYSVKIGKPDGNYVYTCPFKVNASTSKSTASSVKVYPNPVSAHQEFTIEIDGGDDIEGNVTILIYNQNGTLARRISNAASITRLSLPTGQYTGAALVDGKQLSFRVIIY